MTLQRLKVDEMMKLMNLQGDEEVVVVVAAVEGCSITGASTYQRRRERMNHISKMSYIRDDRLMQVCRCATGQM